jgi:hypothetical protein
LWRFPQQWGDAENTMHGMFKRKWNTMSGDSSNQQQHRIAFSNSPRLHAALKALGLPPHITSFSLHLKAGQPVRVDVSYLPSEGEVAGLLHEIGMFYNLVPGEVTVTQQQATTRESSNGG